MIDGDGSWGWTMKSMQNEKIAKTIGETKKFEGRIVAKSEIYQTIEIYIQFLTATNRRVRQTTGNVMRAQRFKIQEIGLN